jgi:hypothetical protein
LRSKYLAKTRKQERARAGRKEVKFYPAIAFASGPDQTSRDIRRGASFLANGLARIVGSLARAKRNMRLLACLTLGQPIAYTTSFISCSPVRKSARNPQDLATLARLTTHVLTRETVVKNFVGVSFPFPRRILNLIVTLYLAMKTMVFYHILPYYHISPFFRRFIYLKLGK